MHTRHLDLQRAMDIQVQTCLVKAKWRPKPWREKQRMIKVGLDHSYHSLFLCFPVSTKPVTSLPSTWTPRIFWDQSFPTFAELDVKSVGKRTLNASYLGGITFSLKQHRQLHDKPGSATMLRQFTGTSRWLEASAGGSFRLGARSSSWHRGRHRRRSTSVPSDRDA